ncbi:HesA/MoeB/ThiF family protein [Pseudalkalibacillus sp. R45]|uniref:HesA/MoeB/ThiF family protein n=1 Tax=Pseudalkalibacillus sp. R45 TaxID=3457433 RepID=UPI003FCD544D
MSNDVGSQLEKRYLLKRSTFISKVAPSSVNLLIRGDEEVKIDGDPDVIIDFVNLLKKNITLDSLINEMAFLHGISKDDCLEVLDILISSHIVYEVQDHRESLTKLNVNRFSRQLSYFSIFNENTAQELDQLNRLLDAKVTLLGVGGVGAPVADLLVRSGIRKLRLIDGDRIELSNLNRQTLYSENDVGELKVEIAKKKLNTINSQVEIEALTQEMKSVDEIKQVIDDSDIVIVSADTPRGKMPFMVNEACIEKGIPFIFTGYSGDFGIVGPLIVPGETYCLECGTEEQERLAQNLPSDVIEKVNNFDSALQPPSIGPICNIVSSITTLEVIRYLTQIFQPNTLNTIVSINTLNFEFLKEPLKADKKCKCFSKEVIHNES